jgi:CRP-like cAMP-binding protein
MTLVLPMTSAGVSRLADHSHRVPFHADSRIFNEGGRANRFWLIRDGTVNLDVHLPGRGDVVFEQIGPGQVLGWSWLFPPYRWHFGASAAEPGAGDRLRGRRRPETARRGIGAGL